MPIAAPLAPDCFLLAGHHWGVNCVNFGTMDRPDHDHPWADIRSPVTHGQSENKREYQTANCVNFEKGTA